MSDSLIAELTARMDKSIESLKHAMSKIRTGRANASLLDHVMVSCYDAETPLNQVANVTVQDARTLSVSPWDKSLMQAVEKAIQLSNLGLNPMPYEDVIRVPIPQLNEERRRDLAKVIKEEGEQARVAIRHIRRDGNQEVKQQQKDKVISDDDAKRLESQIQTATDDFIKQIDVLVADKENEIMTI